MRQHDWFKFHALCAIWYYLYNLKTWKTPMQECYFKQSCRLQPATLLKVTLLHWCFSCFLNCMNGTKPYKAWQLGSWDSRMEQLIHFWTLWPNCNSLTNYYHGYYHYYYYFELEVNPEKSKIHSPISGQCFISIPPGNV